ncbi:DNA polymerase III subunit delta [Buchnera aphidicola (Rhopalosiphum padi)]|uniref:DNA polymerase III subunit delta n=1 Tax=Buchnera aphidicola subsp. Rhopalosiphum padi TaxID=98793 RepID=A0A4D6Y6Y5_BUCRP|nr:DNA polymerase III subunit delta [Buchnera aphidicola]QCI25072.1 DNA polymerase III subunit delta [Buchnera aphidicola (Rhopalosiphum padi)]
MKIIYPEELKKKLIKKLNYCYILLGEDSFFLNKTEKLIFNIAKNKKFIEKNIINIEKAIDWNKVINFYKLKNLFFKKTILIINFIIKKLNPSLIKDINEIPFFKNKDILIILKFNELSGFIKKSKTLKVLMLESDIIYCSTPYEWAFKNWLQYEIKKRNLKITRESFSLLHKYYEGNALCAYQILDILLITWPNENIRIEKIKKIINQFSIFSPSNWINAIFNNDAEKAIYILDGFFKQKYNPLILIRSLQKDLLILLNMKREKKLDINIFLKKNNVWFNRSKFFINALRSIDFNNFLKIIRILLQIEIKIKKEYNNSVWIQLKTLTLLLSSPIKYIP